MKAQTINDYSTYVLAVLMFAPHATKECVEICNGPVFISPAILGMFTPFVRMDMSLHGFLMQLLFAPLIILPVHFLFTMRSHEKLGSYFQVYLLRWFVFVCMLIFIYNVFFWGGLRSYLFPAFIF